MAALVCVDCPSAPPSTGCDEDCPSRSSFSGLPSSSLVWSSIPAISSSSRSSSSSIGRGALGASRGLSETGGGCATGTFCGSFVAGIWSRPSRASALEFPVHQKEMLDQVSVVRCIKQTDFRQTEVQTYPTYPDHY